MIRSAHTREEGMGSHYTLIHFDGYPSVETRGYISEYVALCECLIERVYFQYREPQLGDRWLDAGAHIGAFSLACAFNGAHVVAMEPIPENRRLLKRNVKRTLVDDLVSVSACVLVADTYAGTTIPFYRPAREEDTTTARMAPDTFLRYGTGERLDLPVMPFASAVRLAHATRVKLDVEGAEADILLAAPQEILAILDQIVMEYHTPIADNEQKLPRVMARLMGAGFNIDTHADLSTLPDGLCIIDAWRDGEKEDRS